MQELSLKQKKLDFRTQEEFKTLRTNIEFSGTDVKTVLRVQHPTKERVRFLLNLR